MTLHSGPINIYTDGACKGNPGRGGWAAIVDNGHSRQVMSGGEPHTTNNRMELMAAIKGLEAAPPGSNINLYSDSQYLVKTMTLGWRRRANHDLWRQLDALADHRRVSWRWLRGHAGHPENEMVNDLAERAALSQRR